MCADVILPRLISGVNSEASGVQTICIDGEYTRDQEALTLFMRQ